MTEVTITALTKKADIKFGTSGLRGLVTDLTDEICYAFTNVFLASQGANAVAIGHDLRPSSPRIARACFAAATSLGIDCHYIGALPTPALAYYCLVKKSPGIMITGSHIPFDRNGLKFYRADGEITKDDEALIMRSSLSLPSSGLSCQLPEINHEALALYKQRYLDFFGANFLSGKTIAIYQHSGVARDFLKDLFKSLGAETVLLGRAENFTPIDTEAVSDEDHAQAIHWANEHAFDMLVSTDGDADRPLIADEKGHYIRGDILGTLTAQYLHADHVVTPVTSNTSVEITPTFKSVTRTKIGSPYVIERMMTQATESPNSTVVGYEANGGFILGSTIKNNGTSLLPLPTRDAILPMLCTMAMSIKKHSSVSTLLEELPDRYTHSDRLQDFSSTQSGQLLNLLRSNPLRITKALSEDPGSVLNSDETDGLRLTFENGDIVHIRPSGNAPELRCYAESDSDKKSKQIVNECLKGIRALEDN